MGGSGNINEASQSPRPLVWLLIKSPNFRYVEAGGAGVSRERVCLRARTCLPIFSTWHLIPFLAGDCHQYLSSDRDGNISNETFSWMDEIVTNTTSLPFSHAGVQKDMIIKILESIDSRSARNPDEGRDKSLSRNGDIAMCCASTCWSDEHQTTISLRTQNRDICVQWRISAAAEPPRVGRSRPGLVPSGSASLRQSSTAPATSRPEGRV